MIMSFHYAARIGVFLILLIIGCARGRPATPTTTATSVSPEALARAIAPDLRSKARTFYVDAKEQLSGRSRCGVEASLRCPDLDLHAAFAHALAAQLGGKVVSRAVDSLCNSRTTCVESRDAMALQISIPVIDSTGRIEIDISSYIGSQGFQHPKIERLTLECARDSCIVVGRKRSLIG